jgi:hypothetical protein
MAQNFVACDRDQVLLLPPDVRQWLPAGRLVWFVIDAVAALDLGAFTRTIGWMGMAGRRMIRR